MSLEVVKPQEEQLETETKTRQISRRDFIDVLAKTSIVGSAFAIGVFAGGCGNGNTTGVGGSGTY